MPIKKIRRKDTKMTQMTIPTHKMVDDTYRTFIIKAQAGLTGHPAIGPVNNGEGEAKKAEYLEQLLTEIHCDSIEEINAPDDRVNPNYRPNVIAKINGKSDKKTTWILSHIDVVPPGDLAEWNTDPFKVVEKDGKLYGLGTEDNQQAIISSILAVKIIQDMKTQPEYNIGLLFVSDEETGSEYGIQYIMNQRPGMFQPQDLIIAPDSGDAEGIRIEVAGKSNLQVQCETIGIQTHASTPEKGKNAFTAASNLVVKLNNLYKEFDKKDNIYDPPISTFEPTKKEKNIDNVNTIPGKDVFYVDCRILPCYPIETVLQKIRSYADEIAKIFDVMINTSFVQGKDAPSPTPVDAPVVKALQKAVKEITGKETRTIGIGGGTVAANFRAKNLPAVCWTNLDDTLHKPNEYCKIDNVITDARVFAHIFLQP